MSDDNGLDPQTYTVPEGDPIPPDEERIRFYMDDLGMARHDAEILLAIEDGDSDGDVIEVDEQGKPIPLD